MNVTKVFECEVCWKRCPSKKSRRLHRKTHDKVPVTAAANQSTSQDQAKSQEKPTSAKHKEANSPPQQNATASNSKSSFQCSFCQKMRRQNRDLVNHIAAKHTTFNCAECSESFNSRISFTAHQKLHKKKYQCSQCSKTSLYATLMKRHVKVQHGSKIKSTSALCGCMSTYVFEPKTVVPNEKLCLDFLEHDIIASLKT